jgi:hypothetical protein
MARSSRGRWLQFNLRTMFVLWTALAAWLGWTVHVVHERQALRKELTVRSVAAFIRRTHCVPGIRMPLPAYAETPPSGNDSVSWMRRCFGDESIETIVLHARFELRRVQRVFPEATIRVKPPEPLRTLPQSEPQEQQLPVASTIEQDACWS